PNAPLIGNCHDQPSTKLARDASALGIATPTSDGSTTAAPRASISFPSGTKGPSAFAAAGASTVNSPPTAAIHLPGWRVCMTPSLGARGDPGTARARRAGG